jgi:putative FmdB family regulatory protein
MYIDLCSIRSYNIFSKQNKGVMGMPFYDLRCKECGEEFNIRASIKERENKEIECPNCHSHELEAVFKSVNIISSSKSSDSDYSCTSGCCGGSCGF